MLSVGQSVSGSPVIYTTVPSQMLTGGPVAVPTLVTAGFPLLVDADRLPISKLAPSTPGGGGRPRPASVSPSAASGTEEPPRKNSHNAIEKRYRTSINDKIQDMRVLVCGPDSDSKVGEGSARPYNCLVDDVIYFSIVHGNQSRVMAFTFWYSYETILLT